MTQETLNESTSELGKLLRWTALSVAGLVIVVCLVVVGIRHLQASDPYIHTVLEKTGDADRGAAIFQMNCAVCHGFAATGEVGPNLRGVSARKTKVSLIKQVISGKTPPMPQFQPNPQDMADLLQYLERL